MTNLAFSLLMSSALGILVPTHWWSIRKNHVLHSRVQNDIVVTRKQPSHKEKAGFAILLEHLGLDALEDVESRSLDPRERIPRLLEEVKPCMDCFLKGAFCHV